MINRKTLFMKIIRCLVRTVMMWLMMEVLPTDGRYSREGARRPRKEMLLELTCSLVQPTVYWTSVKHGFQSIGLKFWDNFPISLIRWKFTKIVLGTQGKTIAPGFV